jgi:transcriptional regulator with XRE-family HTH domain
MGLNENLILLRKKHNLSQEDLAEKLSVSRQSISKWESGTGYPEVENLITLSTLFKVDLDTLVKGNIENDTLKKLYEKESKIFAASISIGIAVIILTVAFASKLESFVNGPALFFLFIGMAVANFILFSFRNSNFKIKHPTLNFKYSNDEILKFNNIHGVAIAFGVFNIFLAIILSTLDFPEEAMLSLIALSVLLFVYFSILKGKMDLDSYNVITKEDNIIDTLCAIIMISATIIFFLLIIYF